MTTLLILLGTSFLLGILFTPLARRLAARLGLVDQPDGRRKMHARPIPLTGGLAVFGATVMALAVVAPFSRWLPGNLGLQSASLTGLLLAALVICAVGVLDDLRRLRGRHKLLGQILAVGIVIACGVQVRTVRLFDWQIEMGPFQAWLFTAFWLLGAINSLNLIDGMDGLLGTLGVIICLAMAVLAIVAGQWATAAVAVAMAGALLAFLCFNFPPASVFLGDCGSMLVGLVVGVLAINSSLKGPATVTLAAPVAIFTIPIFDTLAAIVRRKLTGRSIYTTDRGHIHHCLMRCGLSTRGALLTLSVFSLLAVLGALASVAANSELVAVISALTVVCILVFSRLFGHAEVNLIKERLFGLCVSFLALRPQGSAHEIEVRLQGSADWQDLWRSLTAYAEQLNLKTLRLDVNAPAIYEGYHARWDRLGADEQEAPNSWRAEIPLLVRGQLVGRLEVTGSRSEEPVWRKVARMAKVAEEIEEAVSQLTASRRAALVPQPAVVPAAGYAELYNGLVMDRADA